MPAGDYQKIREIGSGSFGRAYLIQDTRGESRRLFVVKEIDISRMGGRERQAAEMEVKVLSSLKHPYIVRYRENYTTNSHLCIVMDYCEGGDLWQHLQHCKRRGMTISEATALRWFTQMTLALKYMHDRHVLHRDLKSQNMFLSSKDGRPQSCVKIADFGIAKVLHSDNAFARTTVGTPYYLSPEMCQKQPYSWTSDVWALGCVLHELCTLRVPFDAEDLNSLIRRIVQSPTPRLPPMYSKELVELGLELLSREASRRPTATALIQHPLLQEEIKRMLAENRELKEAAENGDEHGVPSREDRAKSAKDHHRARPGPSPLGDHNARGPSPSPKWEMEHPARGPSPRGPAAASPGRGGPRAASPHRQAAREVIRPSRAPTPQRLFR